MLSTVKTYAIATVGVFISALLIAVRVLTSQNSKLRTRVETSQARVRHAKNVLKKDSETDVQTDERLEALAKDIENGDSPSELTDANIYWLHDNKDSK